MAREKIPHEPSAAERAAQAQKQWTKQAKAQAKVARKARRQRARSTRLAGVKTPAISLGAFAVIVLVVALVQGGNPFAKDDNATDSGSVPGLASGTTGNANTTTTFALAGRTYKSGDCVDWDQQIGDDTRSTNGVLCTSPHLFEVVSTIQTPKEWSTYPGLDAVFSWAADACQPDVTAYLGHPLPAASRFSVGSIAIFEEGWQDGDRDVTCGIDLATTASYAKTDTAAQVLTPFSGAVKGLDESVTYEGGTCLRNETNDYTAGTVDCAQPHTTQIVGTYDLTGRATLPTTPAELNDATSEACLRAATLFLGHAPRGDEQWGRYDIDPTAWAMGVRTAQCTVGKANSSGGWQTFTGSLAATA